MERFQAGAVFLHENLTIMAKRFIDTELLKNPSLRVTPTLYKLFWVGYLTLCDHAGIWAKDFEMMSLLCGGEITEEGVRQHFGEKFVDIDNGRRWFLPDFIEFQYPKGLNPKVAATKSVIKILKKYGIYEDQKQTLAQPLPNPSLTLAKGLQDKDKDKEEDMDKEEAKISKNENRPNMKPPNPNDHLQNNPGKATPETVGVFLAAFGQKSAPSGIVALKLFEAARNVPQPEPYKFLQKNAADYAEYCRTVNPDRKKKDVTNWLLSPEHYLTNWELKIREDKPKKKNSAPKTISK